MMSQRIRFALASLRGFANDVRGVAAVEFAFLVPLLMLMTFGTFELTRAIIVHKRFQRVSAMVGDLVAREQQLGTTVAEANDELDGIMRSAENVMRPYSTTPLQVAIMSVRASSTNANDTKVEWSYNYLNRKSGVPVCPAAKAMPAAGMITAGNSAVIVESQYRYTLFLKGLMPQILSSFNTADPTINYSDRMVFSPRNSCIDYAGKNCSGGCP